MEELSPKQLRAIACLAAGYSNKEASEQTGIGLRTIEGWKSQLEFKKQLRDAVGKVFDQAIAELVLGAQDAAKALREMITNEEISEKTRITAINTLLSHAAQAKTWALEQRLERVEGMLDGTDQEQATED